MKILSCSQCERVLEIEGVAPGTQLTCSCGNVEVVPPKDSPRRRYGLRIVLGLCLVLACTPCVVLSTAMWVPYRPHSRHECKTNLKTWFTLQRALKQEKDFYTTSTVISGFNPERGNRYAYFAGPGPLENRSTPTVTQTPQETGVGVDIVRHLGRGVTFRQLPMEVALRLGVSGKCPDCNITMACMGQLDDDETFDVWTISTADRPAPDGTLIPAGTPYNDVNDLEQ